MEIKTCEEYVLNELDMLQNKSKFIKLQHYKKYDGISQLETLIINTDNICSIDGSHVNMSDGNNYILDDFSLNKLIKEVI